MMDSPLIHIGAHPAAVSATAEAIALILQIGAENRTSESVLSHALQVLGKTSDTSGCSISNCTFVGEKAVKV